jgi:ribosomal protein S17E
LIKLPKEFFVNSLLKSNDFESNKKLGKAVIRTIIKSANQLAEKYHSYLSIS